MVYQTRNPVSFLAALACTLVLFTTNGQEPKAAYTISPAPSWVENNSVPQHTLETTNHSDGVLYLLLDRQIDLETEAVYQRHVKRVTSESGLRNEAQLEFVFEPSHQTLILHAIHVRRNGQVLDRLKPETLRIIQQERDSSRQIYNGEVSVHAVLEDVRVGDEIESSYTTRGFNPIFERRFSDSFFIQFSVPVMENRLRIRSTADRPSLIHRPFGSSGTPIIREESGKIEHRWVFRDLQPLTPDDRLPTWYQPYPWIQFTEFKNWIEVRDWAMRHYEPSTEISPEVRDLIARLKTENPNLETQTLAALKFVQEEVRYLGMEIGANSHKPHEPSTVLARRFGDCKDKTVLLCALLRGFGVEADAALVNTFLADKLNERLPSPIVFDHVILRAKLGGETYWLDPTLTYQRGTLRDVSVDDYHMALVVHKSENKPVSIRRKASAGPTKTVNEKLVIQAYGGAADLTVETIYRGAAADDMRAYTSRSSLDDLQKEYLNYYLRVYPAVTNIAQLVLTDDTQANRLTTLEKYSIAQVWEKPTKPTDDFTASFDANAITEATPLPRISERTMPLHVRFPTHIRHVLSIDLPAEGAFPTENKIVEDEFQKFEFNATHVGTNLLLAFNFETRADSVPAQKVPAYLKNLNEIRDLCSYSALFPQETAQKSGSGVHWPSVAIAIMTSVIVGFTLIKLYQWRPAPAATAEPPELIDPKLNGLRGWLWLVGLAVVMSPIRISSGLPEVLPAYTTQTWHYVTHPESAGYHPLYAPLLIGEMISNITLLGMSLLLFVLFFQRRSTFPRLYIAFLLFNFVFQTADLLAMRMIPALAEDMTARDYRDASRAFSAALIWTAYMLASKRVKATFIR